jgi:hypothetical protein
MEEKDGSTMGVNLVQNVGRGGKLRASSVILFEKSEIFVSGKLLAVTKIPNKF